VKEEADTIRNQANEKVSVNDYVDLVWTKYDRASKGSLDRN